MSADQAEPWWAAGRPPVLPPDPDLEPLHQREYRVRAWKRDEQSMLLRGAVMDQQPGDSLARSIREMGGQDDGHAVTMHHMVVDLVVTMPDLVIADAEVLFEIYPQDVCPGIAASYRELIGVSIGRGFTRIVRDSFGGPRGCTHTTALLQAMAPVAVQARFAFTHVQSLTASEKGASLRAETRGGLRDTCHAWAEPNALWQAELRGERQRPSLPYRRRLSDAGIDEADLRRS